MNPRLDFVKLAPEAYRAMASLEKYLASSGLNKSLRHMVKLRASQINGCAYCIDMHWKDAHAAGESEQRLYGLDAWEESPYYSDRERAAFAWTEALTLVDEDHVPDAVFDKVRTQFSEKEIADLTWLVASINAWNRVAIGLRAPAGSYQVGMHHT
jgi:AhpD family alkylhydroperoxidase